MIKRNLKTAGSILQIFVSLFISLQGKSQICSGSFGDPVVNISFGDGGNGNTGFPPPLAYTYTTSSCPNDGFYTITTSASGCFNNSWHTVLTDHTGNGAFMLVNASFNAGDFFVTTVDGLCPNTTYEFAAWILNMLISSTGIKPDLTFTIETPTGTILQTFNTGGIDATAQPQWNKYGFFFTTSPGNPAIVLRVRNNAPGGIGNDLALDDITFRPCGPKIISTIQRNSDTINICVDQQLSYLISGDVSNGFILPVYQWQFSYDSGKKWTDIPDANNLIYNRPPTGNGNYWYQLTVAEQGSAGITGCRVASNAVVINVYGKPVVNAGPDRTIIKGDSIGLKAIVTGASPVYVWSPPDNLNNSSILNPVASPTTNKEYTLSAVSSYGCKNEDKVIIKVVADIFVPTAFTPNNDGKNDNWRIPYLDPQLGATVLVYNRYGNLVYTSTAAMVEWDGTVNGIPQQTGTYVYVIMRKGRIFRKGTVSLIR